MPTSYDLSVARHRFCSWAACRAAQAGSAKAKRNELLGALAHSGVVEYLQGQQALQDLTQEAFDLIYIEWVTRAVSYVQRKHSKALSFGVAAKLISVYLKGAYVLHSGGDSRLAHLIHPPIDSLLLKAIDRAYRTQFDRIYKWQKLDQTHYMLIIESLRKLNGNRPFWLIEQHWEP